MLKKNQMPGRKEMILQLHEMAMNNSEIATRVKCSREYVRQVLDLFGLSSPYGKGRPKKRRDGGLNG